MSGVSAAAAAKAAGISEAELSALEDSGRMAKKLNFAALAPLIGLNAAKLEGIANGWLPTEKDLGAWRELRCSRPPGEGMAVNCYLVWDEVTREAALFDTGWDAKPVLDCIAENQLTLCHIFITHSHHDHVAALGAIREEFPKAKVHSGSKSAPVDQRNKRERNRPSRRPAHHEPRHARPRGGRRDLHRRQLAGGRAARGDGGRRDFCRVNRSRQPVVGFGEAENPRANFIVAA